MAEVMDSNAFEVHPELIPSKTSLCHLQALLSSRTNSNRFGFSKWPSHRCCSSQYRRSKRRCRYSFKHTHNLPPGKSLHHEDANQHPSHSSRGTEWPSRSSAPKTMGQRSVTDQHNQANPQLDLQW